MRKESGQTRLSKKAREDAIVEGAITYFADVGFSGKTRALAEHIGISQSLLYKHFATKDDLIERVFQEVYLKRWNPIWETILEDQSLTARDRLVKFYDSYIGASSDNIWIRIFMFASLEKRDINTRYLALIRDRVIPRICLSLREYRSEPAQTPLSESEVQAAWALHGSMLYFLIQKNIYMADTRDAALVIRDRVDAFMFGAAQRPDNSYT